MRRYGRAVLLVGTLGLTATVAVAAVTLGPNSTGLSASDVAPVVARGRAADSATAQPTATPPTAAPSEVATAVLDVPADSGTGRRVIFDQSEQRVWLVGPNDRVRRTYLVSGSATDNLSPGSYEVYSRSQDATSYDLSSTMRYFVRFTQGDTAAIGFHDIPRDTDGRQVQTRDQLGLPLSSGCIRQARADAKALGASAPVGTAVSVVA